MCFNSPFEGGERRKTQTKEEGKSEQGSGMLWLEGKGTVKMMAPFLGTETKAGGKSVDMRVRERSTKAD